MSKILGNIYDISIAIVFGTVFFSSFWRLWKLIFWQNFFQRLIFMFSFYPKNSRTGSTKTSITQELLVIENCPTPRWVTFLIFCRLVYDILSFEWPNFGPKYLVTGQPPKFKGQPPKGHPQNSRLVYEIFQFLSSKCNLNADSNLVIIMKLKRKIEYSWACTFWAN